jgi:hypothetical protein
MGSSISHPAWKERTKSDSAEDTQTTWKMPLNPPLPASIAYWGTRCASSKIRSRGAFAKKIRTLVHAALLPALCASNFATAQPQAPAFLTASSLALSCARVSGSQAPRNDAEATCIVRMISFLDGWRAGAHQGVVAALIHDSPVFLQGAEPFGRRVELIFPIARCLPAQATILQVIPAYLDYMAMHPERAQEKYDAVLPDAINTLCK